MYQTEIAIASKYFLYAIRPHGLFVSLVDGYVAFGLLYGHFVAVVDMVANPLGDILCGRIDLENVVDILMVERVLDHTLDVGEVHHHSVLVQCLRLAVHNNNPVVAVQCFTLTLVTQMQVMCC